MRDLPDWAAEEQAYDIYLDTLADDQADDDDEYMTREELDLP